MVCTQIPKRREPVVHKSRVPLSIILSTIRMKRSMSVNIYDPNGNLIATARRQPLPRGCYIMMGVMIGVLFLLILGGSAVFLIASNISSTTRQNEITQALDNYYQQIEKQQYSQAYTSFSTNN